MLAGIRRLPEAPDDSCWLAGEIRGGKRDGEAQVYGMLRAAMLARLREVNPNLLEEEKAGNINATGLSRIR